MKTRKKYIAIQGITDVTNFVAEACKVEGDVLCRRGRHAIDGKSLMGIMSIDISQGVIVEYPENANDFENFIKLFEVAKRGE